MRVLPLNVVPIPQRDWGPEGGEEWREEGGGENKAERKCERGRGYQVMGTEYSAIQTSHELVGQNSWWQGRKKRCVEIEKWVLVERERNSRTTDWKMNGKGKEGEGQIPWKRKRDESEDINSTAKKGSHICMQLPVQLYISSWQSCSHHFLSFLPPPPARLFPLLPISLKPLATANGDREWGSAWMNGLFLS